jgi:hypothetical protein
LTTKLYILPNSIQKNTNMENAHVLNQAHGLRDMDVLNSDTFFSIHSLWHPISTDQIHPSIMLP